MIFRPKRILFFIFLAWLFISAFYYAPNLIAGQLIIERGEDFWHKALKYIATAFLGFCFLLLYHDLKYLLQLFFFYFLALFLIVLSPSGAVNNFGFDVVLVLAALSGLSNYASGMNAEDFKRIFYVILISSVMVSVISYFEYFIFEPILGDFWRNTGGFRSVSTMLNPNNLGIYLGACLVLLLFSNFIVGRRKLLCGLLVLGALLLTGSRTAIFSLVISIFLGAVYRGGGRISISALKNSILIFLILSVLSSLLVLSGVVVLPERAVDFETAFIRLGKYFQFVVDVDFSYFLPDFGMKRIDVVSESAYFHFLNALGLLLFFPVALFACYKIDSGWLSHICRYHRGRFFDVAVLYYLIAMLFENVFMSFPNNQLLFIVLGASVAFYKQSRLGGEG